MSDEPTARTEHERTANGRQVEWWQRGVLYQVYPRSFQDSDGDGVGDLRGIRRRLDYLQWLGVDGLWLSPIYPSPMADFGYDVADYRDVDPLFGTLADLDALIADAHARGMRVLLDFVPNHSSDQHPWFVASRSSRANPWRDWYIWRDPAPDGGPPNDWQSVFLGSAWELDQQTGQYYFHSFLKEQPDLNWANPEVRAAMADVMRFWLDRGVDGFRVDVIWLLAKGPELEPLKERLAREQLSVPTYEVDQPAMRGIVAGLRDVIDEYEQRLLIGEIYLPLERLVTYYGSQSGGLHMPFNFQLLRIEWSAESVMSTVERYEALLPEHAWPNWVLGNHDNPRPATRFGAAQARAAAMLMLTLRGTPTIYYGDELGMADVDVPTDAWRDPQGLRGGRSRDPQRTPMRWDGSPLAGFTTGDPWLPIGPGATTISVDAQRGDPGSMLELHRRLIALRRSEPALAVGDFESLGVQGDVLGFVRHSGAREFVVALNLGSQPARFVVNRHGRVAISTHAEREGRAVERDVELLPDEGVLVEVEVNQARRDDNASASRA